MKTDYELEDLSYEECRVRAHGAGAAKHYMNQKGVILIDTLHNTRYT